MGDKLEDSLMLIDPEILKKELVISLPILTESDIEMMLNVEEPSSDLCTSEDDEKDKPCLKRDQRRLNLLNNPDYGIILSFLDKFRSHISFKNYPLRIFEDNLICEKEKISGRFMDFHLALLKKISPGKSIERSQFVASMTKFAYRYDHNDGEHLTEHGYSKAKIETKLRILKNLLELQFERNQTLKNTVAEKSASEVSPKPFGRDRFGGTYWLFTDNDCFVRLFREDTDENRTWISLSKNSQELENIIKLLISDYAVRKKFPDWRFAKESLRNVSVSRRFEDEYGPTRSYLKEKNEESGFISIVYRSTTIKAESTLLDPVVSLDREIPSPPSRLVPVKNNVEARRDSKESSDQDSISSEIINGNRLSISSLASSSSSAFSNEISQEVMETEEQEKVKDAEEDEVTKDAQEDEITKDAIPSSDTLKETMETEEFEEPKDDDESDVTKDAISSDDASKGVMETEEQCDNPKTTDNNTNEPVEVDIVQTQTIVQATKRKLVDYEDSESDISSNKTDEPSQNSQDVSVNNDVPSNPTDLPIALRRPRRSRRSFLSDQSADSSSTNKSVSDSSRKKRNIDRNWRRPSQLSRSRSRRRRNRKSQNGFSSSTSDERHPSEDDFSDESFPKNTEFDKFLTGDLIVGNDEDEGDDSIPDRRAKTVAQFEDLFPAQSKPCIRCAKSDRTESLLLCEDCSEAYHLECLQPELLAVPNEDWYCPLCEHKRLCDGLIVKLTSLIKDEEGFEMRRRLMVSKRRKRLTNVMVNVDRFVGEADVKKPKPIKKVQSSDDDGDKANVKKANSIVDDKDDVDSVYGPKNDENRKPSDQEEPEQDGKRRVRSCRRKAQNYSLDDYDKKIKAAMIDAGVNRELVDNDSDDSDNVSLKRKPSKKRQRYDIDDEDFNITDAKNGDTGFMPNRRRTNTTSTRVVDEDSRTMTGFSRSIHEDSRSDGRDDFNDYGMSDDEIGWRTRRQSSTSSVPKKKSKAKSKAKSTANNQQHKSLIISDEDTIPYDPNESDVPPLANLKSEPTTDFGQNEFPANVFGGTEIVKNVYNRNRVVENVVYTNEAASIIKPRRAPRAPKKKKPKIQEENISDEEEKKRPPPSKRLPAKKRRGSNDSSLDDADDDYERLAHKRRLFSHGKAIVRSSITGHIKRLLGQEDDEEEEEEEEEGGGEGEKEGEEKPIEKEKKDAPKKDKNNNKSKKTNQNSQYEEVQLSDDDDFPDDEEILKTTGLINLNKPAANGRKIVAPIRPTFMPSMQSYQFTMVDPTAQFEFTCLPEPEEPTAQPSDSEPVNGAPNPTGES